MSLIRSLWKCTFSPRLFKICEVTWIGHLVDKSYEPKNLERWSDQIVISLHIVTAAIWSITLYAAPLIAIAVPFMYQRGYSFTDNVFCLSKLATGAGALFVASLAARGYSRVNNPVYVKFIQTLNEAHLQYNERTKQELHKYDFEFWAWPVDFDISELEGNRFADKLTLRQIATASGRLRRQGGKDFLFAIPCKLFSYIAAHIVAIKMIYPGSVSIISWAIGSTLSKGRIDLIKQGGERFKLVTANKNQIDTMFVDRRNKNTNGDILVITCEGNCGFYETGIISTPLNKGYSVLGWNHPGFGGSTGAPYPDQEEKAIDCIMRFAIDRLKFPEKRIILYGWSIGGYTATWAAMNYPSIQSLVVLDATFDDIFPLAMKAMPPSLEGLIRNIIRDYFNLNIAEQLNRYNGTVLLVRRTDDEIVCTPNNSLAGNRGNILLTKLLLRRYPHLFSGTSESGTVLSTFLSAEASDKKSILELRVEEKRCLELIAADVRKNNGVISYPSTLGQDCNVKTKLQLILFLATMYMKDQSSSHCIPLTVDLFHPGWDPASTITVK
ncbi:Phosphatidylserine lipase ABHD16A [Formica fusca]